MSTITYLLTNMVTGDEYVGVTSAIAGLQGRLWNHKHRSTMNKYQHLPLYANIREYGWDNFRSSVLCEGDDEKYMCWLLQPTLNQCWVGKKPISQVQVEAARQANNKKVLCVETGVVYENARLADEATPTASYKGISAVCLGKRQRHGGFRWEFI